MRLALLDPSLLDHDLTPSPNTGDQIISRAVTCVIDEVFPGASVTRIPTHAKPTKTAMKAMQDSDVVLVGGSNLLGNRVFIRKRLKHWQQWKLTMGQARAIGRAVLLGVGWRVYETSVHRRNARMLRAVLSSTAIHSTRDSYTARKLHQVGFSKVLNTGCPTLWKLAEAPDSFVSTQRASVVLTTVTDYRPNPVLDRARLALLNTLYDRVVLWPQSSGDIDYTASLAADVEMLSPGLAAVDELIAATNFDYVGTRLHGGIYCLSAGRRSLIVAVDNRAQEMLPEVGLPLVTAEQSEELAEWVENPTFTRLRLDADAIAAWKAQFT